MLGIMKYFVKFISRYVRLYIHKRKWRKRNLHNFTTAENIFPIEKVSVGKYTYGPLNILHYGNNAEQIKIGNFCSIAKDVKFILGGEHEYVTLSTYPFKRMILNSNVIEAKSKGPIIIGDDVWIGYGSIILSGVTIGQGAIIGAGSIVSKDVPPYAIYAGNRIVKYRFDANTIEKLLNFDFSSLDEFEIQNNIDLLYSKIDDNFFDSIFYKQHIKNKE